MGDCPFSHCTQLSGNFEITVDDLLAMRVDDKKHDKMAEAKRVEMYPNKSSMEPKRQDNDMMKGLLEDLQEIDDMLNEHDIDL